MGCGPSKPEPPKPASTRKGGGETTKKAPSKIAAAGAIKAAKNNSAGSIKLGSMSAIAEVSTAAATPADAQTQKEAQLVKSTAKKNFVDGKNPMADAKSKIQASKRPTKNKSSVDTSADDDSDLEQENGPSSTFNEEPDREAVTGSRQDANDEGNGGDDTPTRSKKLKAKQVNPDEAEGSDNSSPVNAGESDWNEAKKTKKEKKKKKKTKKKARTVDNCGSDDDDDDDVRPQREIAVQMPVEIAPSPKPETPEEKFYRLMNLDTWDKGSFDNGGVLELIQSHPEFCKVQYKFDDMHCDVYPLSMLCSLRGQLPTVKACFQAFPAALDETDNFVGTPLHYACTHRAPFHVVSFLIDKQPAHVKTVNPVKRTPLHVACMAKATLETVELLVKRYPKAVELADSDGCLPLHHACDKEAPIEVLSFLIKKYTAACSVKNSDGFLPLHLAVKARLGFAAIEALVSASPETVKVTDPAGNLALHLTLVVHRINTDFAIIDYICKQYPESKRHKNDRGQTPYDLSQMSLKRDAKAHALLQADE